MKQPYNTTIYNTALYMRLSRDDENYGDSVSIETQRTILQQYAKEQGLHVVGEYVDDGWSGRTLLGLDSDTFYIYHVAAVMVDNLRRLLLGINLSDKAIMDFDFRVLVSRSNSCIKIRSINSWTFS